MLSNHFTLCRPLLLPSIFPSNRVFSNESVLHIRWPKYWEFQLWHQSFQWIFRPDFFFNFTWRLITLQCCGGFCHIFTWISHGCTCVPHPDPPSPSQSSGSSQCTCPEHPVWCIEPELAIYFTYNIYVSMLFSQIIPPSPSPTESRSLFFTSVSLLLSLIQGHRYHLSKFHIYVLIYCIGVFLSDLLHPVQ